MTTAVASVEQRFVFEGVDNASKTAENVRRAVRGVAGDAADATREVARVGKAAEDSTREVREKSGDVESALKGVSDFAGGASEEVSKIGDAFGAVEAIMRLLPGPLGLAATAVAGVALASKLLFDMWSENRAKLSLLTDPATRTLGESLGFSADETVKLQAALDGLTTEARPSLEALKQVADNAKAIGAEPADAVAKFISAWERGPEAVAALRSEIGTIEAGLIQLPDLAEQLGLDATAVGLRQATSEVDQLKQALEGVRAADSEIEQINANIAKLRNEQIKLLLRGNEFAIAANKAQIQAEQDLLHQAKFRAEQQREAARAMGQQTQELQGVQKALQGISADAQAAALDAELVGDKQAAKALKAAALDEQRTALLAEQARLLRVAADSTNQQVQDLLRAVGLDIKRLDVQAKQARDQEAADRKAEAARKAAEASRLRQQRAAEATRRAQQQEAELQRILAEWSQRLEQSRERMATAEEARAQISRETAAQAQTAYADQLDAQAAIAQALGRTEDAEAAQGKAIAIRRDVEIAKINATIDALRKEAAARTAAIQTDLKGDPKRLKQERANAALEAADLERQRKLAIAAVSQKAADDERAKRLERLAQERADITAHLQQIATLTSQGLGQFGGTAGKVGQAVGVVGANIEGLSAGFGDLGKSAPAAINAVGGVASAFVEGEKNKAAILAVMSTAQAIAAAVEGNFAAAAGYGTAAALYAGVAGGVISTGSGGGVSVPQGGTTETQTGVAGVTPQQQGATVINFNGVFATKQQVGKALTESQRSLRRTGLATVRGV